MGTLHVFSDMLDKWPLNLSHGPYRQEGESRYISKSTRPSLPHISHGCITYRSRYMVRSAFTPNAHQALERRELQTSGGVGELAWERSQYLQPL